MAFLMQWASQEEKYSCLENFADDWLLQDLLEGKAGSRWALPARKSAAEAADTV